MLRLRVKSMQGGGFFDEDDYIEPPPAQQVNRQRGVPPPPRKVTAPVESDDFDYEGEAALDALERQERGMVLPPPPDDHAPRTVGICEECGEASGQPKFFAAFGVSACYDCQQAARGPGGKYELIIKTKVKGEYFLTDRQLTKERGGLGCLLRPNPYAQSGRSHGGDMKLFLRTQVEALALQAWGSSEGLFNERERRMSDRVVKGEARKRKAAEREQARRDGAILVPQAKRPAAAAKHVAQQSAFVSHAHVFLPDETYDEAKDTWTKRCACGFEVEYERF